MSTCNHQCDSCQTSCDQRSKPQPIFAPPHEQSHVGKVFGIVSGKGGVGKSMITCQLAVLLRRMGFRVGILDADITGPSIPKAFTICSGMRSENEAIYPARSVGGIEIASINLLLEHETDPVLWRGPVITGMVGRFWSGLVWDVDYLLIDMPPGTGDVPLTVFTKIPLSGIFVVATPQELVSMVVEKSVQMAAKMEVPVLGLIENMSYINCPECGKIIYPFGKGKLNEAAKKHGLSVLARIPIDSALTDLVDQGNIEQFRGDWLSAAVERMR